MIEYAFVAEEVNSNHLSMWRNCFRLLSPTRKYCCQFSRNIVTAEQVRTFQDQGVICIRGVFGEWIKRLTKGIERNLANPGKLSEWLKSENSETYYFNDLLNWQQIPEFKEFVFESPAAEIAGKLMDAQVRVTRKYYPRVCLQWYQSGIGLVFFSSWWETKTFPYTHGIRIWNAIYSNVDH